MAIVFLTASIALMDVVFLMGHVEADSISNGLTSEGNQIWKQGSNGLAGTPEGQTLSVTGGQAGSFSTRGDEFGAEMAAGR